ncbi:hypothetical protein AA0474_2592 [Acetobacter lovaniensis NRIC 0474]|jgi:hypothetical protein|uniref:Uncharacterized protein n=1 Tax=Acetobacter lovaniensis TaxID=104100 RepID=A0A841QHX4_9PROT|nr:hypothetical protein [Acetobacter lovaniensis]GBQ71963.1 hypothetical protein AA0474_2592 [Acetobacter lovaniensis NRIC 0474]
MPRVMGQPYAVAPMDAARHYGLLTGPLASHPMRVAWPCKACCLCLGEWREFLWRNATKNAQACGQPWKP